jgi:hypothetical protein
MKRFLISVLMIGLALPGASAKADWTTPGDSLLVVEPGICALYKSANPAYCGPTLSVRVFPLFMNGDGVSVAVTLTGPSGPITLEYGTTAVISNGKSFIDTDYFQNTTQTGTPTNLPYGDYTFVWKYSRMGQWSCSKYYESGCIWSDDSAYALTYNFNWAGTKLETYPIQPKVPVSTSMLNDFSMKRSKVLSGAKVAKKMFGGGYKYKDGDTISLKVLKGKACKISGGNLKSLNRGTCRVSMTATAATGWKYIYKFYVTVK